MNEQPPINEPEPLDRREARSQRRAERLANPSRGSTWVAGVVLILVGVMYFMNNAGIFNMQLRNWWALFILIPAIGSFDTAMRMYRNAGNQLTAPARGSLLVGIVLTLVTLAFIFNINWTFFGPILMILAGIGILLNFTLSNRD